MAIGLKGPLIFEVTNLAIEQGVDISTISNEGLYIKINGTSTDKLKVNRFAGELMQQSKMKPHKFSDSVPFWKNGEYVIIIMLKDSPINTENFVTISSPAPREIITPQTLLEGKCSREGADVLISGDIEAKVKCKNGSWNYRILKADLKQTGFIGVSVSQRLIDQEMIRYYRSFNFKP
jgi:hypothetical protein